MRAAHSLITGDVGSAEFACTCGVRGTYESVLRHVTARASSELTPSLRSQGFPQRIAGEIAQHAPSVDYVSSSIPADSDNFGGGDTKVHYLPNVPKRPAPLALPEVSHDVSWEATPSYIEPEQTSAPTVVEQRESPPRSDPTHAPLTRSIAESFQDMLRVAYQAGAASAATGEIFETWYQREVLR
jgi:hypothetical protein